jgi:cytochrome c5
MIRPLPLLFGAAVALVACSTATRAATPADTGAGFAKLSVDLPAPGAMFSGPGADTLNRDCTMCHSAGFVDRQPGLPAATWTAEVQKMKSIFGAPYAEADIPKIVDALVARQKAMK